MKVTQVKDAHPVVGVGLLVGYYFAKRASSKVSMWVAAGGVLVLLSGIGLFILPLYRDRLNASTDGVKRIEILYLLGEYNRRPGQPAEARVYFAQVKTAEYKDEDGKKKVGHPYFLELVQDRENLMK